MAFLSRFLRFRLSLKEVFLSSSELESFADWFPDDDYPLQVNVDAAKEVNIFSLLRY